MNNEVPLVWTAQGHVPASELVLRTVWEDTPDYIKCTVNYYYGTELVRNDAYVYIKLGIGATAQAAQLPGT